MACVKSEKYVFWVTLRPLESMRLSYLNYDIRGDIAKPRYIKLNQEFHYLLSVSPKQLNVSLGTLRIYPHSWYFLVDYKDPVQGCSEARMISIVNM